MAGGEAFDQLFVDPLAFLCSQLVFNLFAYFLEGDISLFLPAFHVDDVKHGPGVNQIADFSGRRVPQCRTKLFFDVGGVAPGAE